MATKKNKKATTNAANLPALRIGTRVRCTEDGIEGRVVMVNGLMVKIEWTDGEKVTWRRDSLATKPIEIIDDETPPAAETNAEQTSVPTPAEQTTPQEQSSALEETPTPAVPPSEPTADAPASEPLPETTSTTTEAAPTEAPAPETLLPVAEAITWEMLDASPDSETYLKVIGTVTAVTLSDAQAAAQTLYSTPHIVQAQEIVVAQPLAAEVPAANPSPTTSTTEPKRTRKPKKSDSTAGGEKKLSALDAAAKVLAEAGVSLTCQAMIAAMQAQGYWISPGGKTPAATLYSAILREISTKGPNSRFKKTERGRFARTPNA